MNDDEDYEPEEYSESDDKWLYINLFRAMGILAVVGAMTIVAIAARVVTLIFGGN